MPNDPSTWVGQTLSGGRYLVTARLGAGGMALVFRARDCNLETDVVLKVPRPEMLVEPDIAARFASEIRSMVKLAHPHVVKINDVGEHDGIPFAVMQFCAGGSLADRFQTGSDGRRQPMPLTSLADWIMPVAEALDFVHREHYVHRDIKPGNILFDGHGNAYVSDFGIAKVMADESQKAAEPGMTRAGMVVGTGPYMPPEMLMGELYDGRVDQFAMAVTVYEVLSATVPFSGTSAQQILKNQITGSITPLHQVAPSVPEAVSRVLTKALSAEPAQRYANCATFARSLRAAIAGASKRQTVGAGGVGGVGAPEAGASVAPPPTAPPGDSGKKKPTETVRKPPPTTARETKAGSTTTRTAATKTVSTKTQKIAEPRQKSRKTLLIGGGIAAGVLLLAFATAASLIAYFVLRSRSGDPGKTESANAIVSQQQEKQVQQQQENPPPETAPLGKNPSADTPQMLDPEKAGKPATVPNFTPPKPRIAKTNGQGTWSVTPDGLLVQEDAAADDSRIMFGYSEWKDYDFEFEFRIERGGVQVGASCRVQNWNAGYSYLVGSSRFRFERIVDDTASDGFCRTLKLNAWGAENGTWHKAKISARGSKLQCAVNGNPPLDINDVRQQSGGVGLRTSAALCSFKSIRIVGAKGEPLWDGPPELTSPVGANAYQQHEAIAAEAVSCLEDLANAIASVKDRKTAMSAAINMNRICDRLESLVDKAQKVPKLSQADSDKLKNVFEPRILAINQRIDKSAFRAGKASQGEASLQAAALRLQQVALQLQKLGS